MDKKKLKEFINNNGGFIQMKLEKIESPEIEAAATSKKDKNVPEGATFFTGIASNGDLNRNGYIILLTAWKKSIKDFMKNPVVLLGHNHDEPIGRCTKMEITPEGLYVEGYVFDEYTDGKFTKGLITALSTGHFTKQYDFINLKNGQILTAQEFWRRWRELCEIDEKDPMNIENWVRRITETEIVEFSLVAVPANRKSLISSREELEQWHEKESLKIAKTKESSNNINKENMKMRKLTAADLEKFPTIAEKFGEGDEISQEAWENITGEKETTAKTDKEDPEKPGENPGATKSVKGDGSGEQVSAGDGEKPKAKSSEVEKIVISKDDREKLVKNAAEAKKRADDLAEALDSTTCEGESAKVVEKNVEKNYTESLNKLNESIGGLQETVKLQQEQITVITNSLEKIPEKKGLIVHNAFVAAKKADDKEKKEGKDGGSKGAWAESVMKGVGREL